MNDLPSDFGCGFGTVEAVLASMNYISSASRSPFANRLKHLQRQGFPQGINTGRGRAAVYQAHHVALMAFAVELIQLGLLPERAINVVDGNMEIFSQAICDELLDTFIYIKEKKIDPSRQTFIGFDPEGLQSLAEPPDGMIDPKDMASYSLIYGGWESLKRWSEIVDPHQGVRLSIIPMSRFLRRLLDSVSLAGCDIASFTGSLALWTTVILRK